MQVGFKWGVTIADKLALIDQHQQNSNQRWSTTIESAYICSQKEFDNDVVYDDDDGRRPFASTDPEKIKNFFIGRNSLTPVNFNVTYKSFHKLVDALKDIQKNDETAFATIMENLRYIDRDEAHNMVPRTKMKDQTEREHFSKLNEGMIWLNVYVRQNGGRDTSWTATPFHNRLQWDMSNASIHGDSIVCRSPEELRQLGEVVKPRLIGCVVDDANDPEAFRICGTTEDDTKEFTYVLKTMSWEIKYRALTNCPVRILVFSSGAAKTEKFRRITKMLYPGWDVFNVTADTPPRERKKIFEQFKKSPFAILYNYDIISEGSDLDGASAVVLGRNVGQIKLIQIVGRVVRITPADKVAVKETKTRKVDDPAGWQKFFGHIYYYMETQDPENSNYYKKLKEQLRELYSAGYESIIEDSVIIKMPTTDLNVIEDPLKFVKNLQSDEKLANKIREEIHDIESMDNQCKSYYNDLIFNNHLKKIESQLQNGNLDDAIKQLTEAATV